MLSYAPAVYCVGRDYQIVFKTEKTGMAWVEIGGEAFENTDNGLRRWRDDIHKITVPGEMLNQARQYAVCFQAMEDRAPYFPAHGDVQRKEFSFFPLQEGKPVRIAFLSDTHGRFDAPMACVKQLPFDLLVMGGDVADHNSTREDLHLLLRLIGQAAQGERPVIAARGNHDTRGPMAWYLPELMGLEDGRTYFTVEQPGLSLLVLDTGEDKADSHGEYGDTVRFEAFRQEETAWLEQLAKDAAWGGNHMRLAICHNPFTLRNLPPFQVDEGLLRRWSQLVQQMDIPILLAGHTHEARVIEPDSPLLLEPGSMYTVCGSRPGEDGDFIAAHLTLSQGSCQVCFVHSSRGILMQRTISAEGSLSSMEQKEISL